MNDTLNSNGILSEHDAQAARKRAALISVAIGLLMFGGKTGGYFITGSAAILSDAMESVVHVIATGIALGSIVLAGRPKDRFHPYGYGKVEYFSAGIEGMLILLAALAICFEAVRDIIRGPEIRSLDVGVWVIGTAGAVNLALGLWLIHMGKVHRSLVLVADGKHVLTDSFTSIGVLVGLILVMFTGMVMLDPIFAIGVALNILVTGYRLIAQSVKGLMNRSDPDTLQRVVDVMNRIRTPEMIDMHRLRAWSSGDAVFIDFHLSLPADYTLEFAHEVQHKVSDALAEEFHKTAEVMVHLDPYDTSVCLICGRWECDDPRCREQIDSPFTVELAVGNPRRPLDLVHQRIAEHRALDEPLPTGAAEAPGS